VLGVDLDRLVLGGLAGHDVVPPDVAALDHVDLAAVRRNHEPFSIDGVSARETSAISFRGTTLPAR